MIRSSLSILAGVVVFVVILGAPTSFLNAPEGPLGFFAMLLVIEAVAGAGGATAAARLAPKAPTAHGWFLGGLVLLFDIVSVVHPASAWSLPAGIVLLLLVPVQTWVGIRLATRSVSDPKGSSFEQ